MMTLEAFEAVRERQRRLRRIRHSLARISADLRLEAPCWRCDKPLTTRELEAVADELDRAALRLDRTGRSIRYPNRVPAHVGRPK